MSARTRAKAGSYALRGLAAMFLLTWSSYATTDVSADDSSLQLRFKGGGYACGTLLPSDKPRHVRLQCPSFEEPLEFGVQSLSSLEAEVAEVRKAASKQFFVLSNGTVVAGSLAEMDGAHVVIESPCLQKVRLPRSLVHHMSSNRGFGNLLYVGPQGGDDWSGTAYATDWKFEGGALTTSQSGVTAIGYVNLPNKCEVRISLAWSAEPNFTLLLGCSKPAKATDRIPAAASLEVWDRRLMLVREGEQLADMAELPDLLSDRQRLELTLFLDQPSGIVAVCTPNGRLLSKLEIREEKPTLRRLIALSNHATQARDSELRLEQCEVRQWNGELPTEWPEGDAVVRLDDGQVLSGTLGALAPGQTEIAVIGKDGQTTSIPLQQIEHAVVSASSAASETSAEAIVVELADGSHLAGSWSQMDSGKVVFTLDGAEEPVRFLLSDIVRVLGNANQFEVPPLAGKIGRLQTEAALLTGCLADSRGDGVLRWQAEGATAPSRLASTSQGVIRYDDLRQAAMRRKEVSPRVQAQLQGNVLRLLRPGVVVRGNARVVSPQAAAPARKPLEPGLKLRRGDQLLGAMVSIDERGVTFQSPETSVTFFAHDQIDSVVLASSRVADTQSPEKLKRLMTVPRASKNDPPTHLLVSTNGDYLRGRLVKLDEQRAVMEVRLEEVEFATERIAEIHWLYHRDWQADQTENNQQATDAEPAPASLPLPADSQLQVHVLRKDGRPLTFMPSGLSAQTLQGKSDLLGECKVELAQVTTIRFGADLAKLVPKDDQEAWMLSLATLPKVYQESSDGPGESRSPLVGKPAPEFTLISASGEKFELQNHRGRVLVLDFWASWCGPCLQTMPEVERVVEEVGGDQVDLIAVNLQETKERALATVKRLGLSPTVLLDEDGLVAQQYQATAIPQTVIIDRQGMVTHLFVGGGQRFLSEFSEALTEVAQAP